MRRLLSLLVILATLSLVGVADGKEVEPPAFPFFVIVHSSSAATSLTKNEVSRFLLKKVTKWNDGRPIVPIDLAEDSPIRRSFSRTVHGRSAAAVKSYWQQQIFSGRGVPPREVDSEDDVLRLVAQTPGAIGYVSTNAPLKGVAIVKIEE